MTEERQGPLSDAQYQDRLRLVERVRARQRDQDMKTLMSHAWGRRLAYTLGFELGRLHAQSFAPSVKDGVAMLGITAHREGRREMAADFIGRIQEVAPDLYLTMMAEQIHERQTDLALEHRPESSEGESLE